MNFYVCMYSWWWIGLFSPMAVDAIVVLLFLFFFFVFFLFNFDWKFKWINLYHIPIHYKRVNIRKVFLFFTSYAFIAFVYEMIYLCFKQTKNQEQEGKKRLNVSNNSRHHKLYIKSLKIKWDKHKKLSVCLWIFYVHLFNILFQKINITIKYIQVTNAFSSLLDNLIYLFV